MEGWATTNTDWVILNGFLEWPNEWTERIKLVETDLDVSNMTFKIHDAIAPSGIAAGYNVMSYLGAGASSLSFSTLNTTVDTSASDIIVDNGSVFGAGEQIIYIEREAIKVTSRTANTFTLPSTGRGVLGSKIRYHVVDTATSFKPIVYNSFPWMARRRVILWVGKVTSAGVMADPMPVWRGIVSNGPTLDSDGAMWELPADHIWQTFGDVTLGLAQEACRLKGYRSIGGVTTPTLTPLKAFVSTLASGTEEAYAAVPDAGYYIDDSALCANLQARLTVRRVAEGVTATERINPDGDSITFQVASVSSGTRTMAALSSPLSTGVLGVGITGATAIMPAFPRAAQLVNVANSGQVFFASAGMLPTTWQVNTPTSSGSRTGTSNGALISRVGDSTITIDPMLTGTGAVDRATRSITGVTTIGPDPRTVIPGTWFPVSHDWRWMVGELPFQLVVKAQCSDWVFGLRYLIVGDSILSATPQEIDTSSHDWNWDREFRAYEMTPGQLSARKWTLDGQISLRDFVTENIRFAGACVAIRYGSLAIDAISPPLRSDQTDSIHTITEGELLNNVLPEWRQAPDSIANVVDCTFVEGEAETRYIVNDRISVGRFGPRKKIELTVRGIDVPSGIRSLGPRVVGDHLFSRTLGLWSQLTETITVKVSLEALGSIFIGDVVTISEWLAPNQSRTRGWSTRKAVVIGRTIDPHGHIALECLAWPESNVSGFSPCLRIVDITEAVCTANIGYANGQDYSGSEVAGYANSTIGTIASDGGTGYFAAGMKVELVERDNISPRAPDSFTIDSVNTGTPSVTLTAAPNAAWAAIIAGGGTVDLRFDAYSTASLTTTQKTYCWIAANLTYVIDSTSDAAFRWVP